jgi:alpha-tubulin suppressor-like RCC1 family protein
MSNSLRKIALALAGLLAASAATAAQPQIEGSTLHTLALQADGTVLAWGQDNHGELGQERILSSTTPVQVINLRDIAAISSGMDYSLALGADGTVWAWGANNYGELGDGSKANSATPVRVAGLPAIAHIAAGSGTSLAVASDGSVWAWGLNSNGVLGDGTTTDRWTPAPVSGLANVTAIAASSAFPHSLALKSDGTVWAWGRDTYGSLGLPDNAETCSDGLNDPVACARLPQQVPGLTDIVAIAADWGKNIALRRDGTVWVWGNGLGTTPQQVGDIGVAGKIAYANGGLALDQAGTLVG